MAAFVVMPWSDVEGMPHTGTRLSIFPGAATPSVFAAGEPFWIGYGFVPEPGAENPSDPRCSNPRHGSSSRWTASPWLSRRTSSPGRAAGS